MSIDLRLEDDLDEHINKPTRLPLEKRGINLIPYFFYKEGLWQVSNFFIIIPTRINTQ